MSPSDPTEPLVGAALLDAITDAIVALHLRHHGRAPAQAKTHLLGDELLACMLSGIYTEVEKTMIELQRADEVHATRHAFGDAVKKAYIDVVQHLSGRTVQAFVSNYHVGPDLAVELFLLEPRPAEAVE
ncbi:DUF2294 domain-containing protein [Solirubrobacter taibaiensis]|nr:DUF2294 domain-containing protein [Solirubrobacter taibaiensis]